MNNNVVSRELKKVLCECAECGRTYKSVGALKTHHKLKHQVMTEEDVKARTCEFCGKVLSSKTNLPSHRRIHLGEGAKFKCPDCTYSTVQKTALIKHQMAKHSNLTFSCQFCSKSFKWEIDLQRHQLKHQGVKFFCNLCTKKFSEKRLLSLHKRTHHEKVVQKCDRCDFETTLMSSLRAHMKAVHEGIIFYCEFCDFKSPRKAQVTRHTTSLHDKEKKHKCDFCEYRSDRPYRVRAHVAKIHKTKTLKNIEIQDIAMNSASGRGDPQSSGSQS